MTLDYLAAIGSAVASAKSAVDLAKSVKEMTKSNASPDLTKQSSDLLDATINLKKMVIDLQESMLVLQKENADLKEKIVKAEKLQHDLEKYRLKELAAGVLVYGLYEPEANGDPVHYLCANCFTNGKKSILQLKREAVSGDIYRCHACDSEICDRSKKQDSDPVIVSVVRSSIDWKGY